MSGVLERAMRQGVAAVADLGQQALHAHGPGNLVAALGIGPGDAFRQHDLRADSPKGGQSGIGKRPGLQAAAAVQVYGAKLGCKSSTNSAGFYSGHDHTRVHARRI